MIDDPATQSDAGLQPLVKKGGDNVAQLVRLLPKLRKRSAEVAERKWSATLAQMAQVVRTQVAAMDAGDAVAAFELSRSLGELYMREVIDELEAELSETPADRAGLQQILRQIEQTAEEGLALSEELYRAAIDVTQARQEAAVNKFEEPQSEVTATVVQTIVETLPNRVHGRHARIDHRRQHRARGARAARDRRRCPDEADDGHDRPARRA